MGGTDGRPKTCSAAFGVVEGQAKYHIGQWLEQLWWHECVAAGQTWCACLTENKLILFMQLATFLFCI